MGSSERSNGLRESGLSFKFDGLFSKVVSEQERVLRC